MKRKIQKTAPFGIRGDTTAWRHAASLRGLAPSTWARLVLDAAAAAEQRKADARRDLLNGKTAR